MYTVYQHIFPNGKCYIGVTGSSVEKRWGRNGGRYKSQFVGRAIEKYGWDNIKHEIFCICESKEQAERVEAFLISYYKSDNPKFGYNVLPYGDVSAFEDRMSLPIKRTNGNIGKKLPEDQKQKIREWSIEHWKSQDARDEASNRAKKRWQEDAEYREKMITVLRSNGGRHPSQETIDKIRNAQKGKRAGDESPCSKAVVALRVDGSFHKRYGGVSEAAREMKTSRGNISMCCNHKPMYNTCKGYIWMFESEYTSRRPF